MVYSNRVRPIADSPNARNLNASESSIENNIFNDFPINARLQSRDATDFDSLSTVGLEESSYLKLRPFSRLDPTIVRLLRFLNCFGLILNVEQNEEKRNRSGPSFGNGFKTVKIMIVLLVVTISGEVVYDINLRQSKLLVEQKRSTPLLTFVIVAYSWLSITIPIFCDLSLLMIGSLLFRFYSRTTATVCDGIYFGKRASVDTWYYYLTLVIIAFLDAAGQVIVLGVWPSSIDPYMRKILFTHLRQLSDTAKTLQPTSNSTILEYVTTKDVAFTSANLPDLDDHRPKIRAYLLDSLLGVTYAHSDIGVCIKIACLMIQFIHSYAFFIIIISLAHHYATAINDINENLDKYPFRRLLKQLIILRDSSEQISLIISLPFSLLTFLVFMRQIALYGVIIQSTMLPYENWAVTLQSFTCTISIIMVFIYCDGLQCASKQTHRLKTEHTVINENKGGNQSNYEFLDYLNRLSKSIRITFFNIIAINKSSLVGLFGHILTLTFVTS